jgi:MerR family transcriptional regulator, light-induced transcriptional regulator
MGLRNTVLDSDAFARAASRFARKRDTLDIGAVEAVSREIVDRLSRPRSKGLEPDTPAVDEAEIEAFCNALMQASPDAALGFIDERRAHGLTRQGVYFAYIGAAARHLGEGWEDDRLNFIEVTIATGHLYALMRALRAEAEFEQSPRDIGRNALFATVPGEDHGIGITVAADLFREAGWDIDLHIGANMTALVARIEETVPSIIGLSLTTSRHLDALVRLVVAARIIAPHSIIGVAPGAGVDRAVLPDLVDIDLVFDDARSAMIELDRLRWLKSGRT